MTKFWNYVTKLKDLAAAVAIVSAFLGFIGSAVWTGFIGPALAEEVEEKAEQYVNKRVETLEQTVGQIKLNSNATKIELQQLQSKQIGIEQNQLLIIQLLHGIRENGQ